MGDAGNDTLDGGAGKDALTGGNGADTFIFNSALSATANVDSIADFVSGLDHLQLNSTIFTKLKGDIDLSDNFFQIGVGTQDANDYIVYNSATGALYYDSNGSVAGGSTQIATLIGVAPLASSDFVIVA